MSAKTLCIFCDRELTPETTPEHVLLNGARRPEDDAPPGEPADTCGDECPDRSRAAAPGQRNAGRGSGQDRRGTEHRHAARAVACRGACPPRRSRTEP